ncbi:MAG: 16S rRNA (cytidine(1402)-2'-O)-methyltransferase [Clostridia bacterium]
MLYLCATPIGNLGDITLRVIDTLRTCDAVYCEDTRHTLGLLNHLEIKKPLISCHQHNERARADEVATLLSDGKNVVYVSDAGMPGISDPGAVLLEMCIARKLPFTVLPGASAVLTAAVLSGLPSQPFTFFGFLPRETQDAKVVLAQIASCGHLAILYESPQRVQKTLLALQNVCGDCQGAVLRELTKKFEDVQRGTLSQLSTFYEVPPRGECVLAIYCKHEQATATEADLDGALRTAFSSGQSVRDAAALVTTALHLPKKQVYARALSLSKEE